MQFKHFVMILLGYLLFCNQNPVITDENSVQTHVGTWKLQCWEEYGSLVINDSLVSEHTDMGDATGYEDIKVFTEDTISWYTWDKDSAFYLFSTHPYTIRDSFISADLVIDMHNGTEGNYTFIATIKSDQATLSTTHTHILTRHINDSTKRVDTDREKEFYQKYQQDFPPTNWPETGRPRGADW